MRCSIIISLGDSGLRRSREERGKEKEGERKEERGKRGKERLRAHPEQKKDDPSKRDHEVEGEGGALPGAGNKGRRIKKKG